MRTIKAMYRHYYKLLHRTLNPRFGHLFNWADDKFDNSTRYLRRNWQSFGVWGFGLCFFFGGGLLLWAATLQLPDLNSLETRRVEQSVKVFDRTGTVLLFDLHKNMQRTAVPIDSVSVNLQQAILSIEDPEFYTHIGIKPTAIARAIWTNFMQGELLSGQGGSTITQQVIKLTILTSDKSPVRKFKEWILALKMERQLTKDQILELYLNQAPFGGQLYGVEEASMTFFGKHASDLSVPESAYLAAMLPAPTRYSPYGTHVDQLEARKNLVLDKMHEHGAISAEEAETYKAEQVTFAPKRQNGIIAPHFVFYVQQYLEEKYGTEALERGGWRVTTTLDADLQVKAEEIVKRQALANVDKYNATNMAMVATDPHNGQILVMVGSRDYFDEVIPGAYNVATMAPGRQPGSSFKPFAYAQAFAEGYTPETVVFDLPTQFSTACEPSDNYNNTAPCYAPQNYDDAFRGPMTLRYALAGSINVPAVKTIYLAGLQDTLRLAKSMGISTLGDANQYGLTLVLGGGEVTPLDMTNAYGAFANNGLHFEEQSILRIEDSAGNVIEDNTQAPGVQVMPASVAQQISDVLSDNAARASLGENDLFSFPGHEVAVKTGTTNDYRDAWTVGFTPNIAVGAWAGNNDNTPMERRVSGFIIGPAWAEFMRYALTRLPTEPFARAELPTPTKPVLNGIWQIPGQDGLIHDILYWANKTNPQGDGNSIGDSQYKYWEYPVQAWVAANGAAMMGTSTGQEDCFTDPATGQCLADQPSEPPSNRQLLQRNNNGTVPR
ncbi:MAG: putative penicillin-binding protein [Candidatus Adlerbacteria bacterium]|nr:putative penicillin-binding protein [Candidatus Adlerbacteria bacterium]